jgi:hypothetical protein
MFMIMLETGKRLQAAISSKRSGRGGFRQGAFAGGMRLTVVHQIR